ncbi:TIGR01777 family oxidoreductase [Stenotrophomonas sp. ISL-67]|uniref:TIGR01777 family oxidoreductase n=1 Tax=Stenotrophomonas sp. ISL-67 TaxID=2819171 RepID=UPI001BE578F5|nr:TIGR01777 family oxidoreductase [Stenotrophomonas sp. ISL-67]MBT2768247.1 TIGR01777 family oxidoreductase [Stenotrophomonas sp. ISL-67]
MDILITGGTGFIGQRLCQRLLQAGHRVTVLTRSPGRPGQPGVQQVGALGDVGPVHAVVNLAGEPLVEGRWNPARKQAMLDSRIGTTQALLAWMRGLPIRPQVLVSGSAIGYYGPRDGTPLDESASPGHDFAATLCRQWEAEALKAEDLRVRTCLLRTGIVLDRHGGALARMLPPFRMGAGGPMGNGTQWMSWIHRDDLVGMILWLLADADVRGACNGTAPAAVTNAAFARTLADVLGRPAWVRTPAFALKLAFGEMAGLLLTGQNVVPARALQEGYRFRYATLDAALRAIIQ